MTRRSIETTACPDAPARIFAGLAFVGTADVDELVVHAGLRVNGLMPGPAPVPSAGPHADVWRLIQTIGAAFRFCEAGFCRSPGAPLARVGVTVTASGLSGEFEAAPRLSGLVVLAPDALCDPQCRTGAGLDLTVANCGGVSLASEAHAHTGVWLQATPETANPRLVSLALPGLMLVRRRVLGITARAVRMRARGQGATLINGQAPALPQSGRSVRQGN